MNTRNIFLLSVKYLVLGLIRHLIYWPVWWFSGGLFLVLKFSGRKIITAWEGLGLTIWLKNLFVPMYGQRDFISRVISFLIRIFQIIFRLVLWLIIAGAIILWPILYLAMPIFIIWQLIILN